MNKIIKLLPNNSFAGKILPYSLPFNKYYILDNQEKINISGKIFKQHINIYNGGNNEVMKNNISIYTVCNIKKYKTNYVIKENIKINITKILSSHNEYLIDNINNNYSLKLLINNNENQKIKYNNLFTDEDIKIDLYNLFDNETKIIFNHYCYEIKKEIENRDIFLL